MSNLFIIFVLLYFSLITATYFLGYFFIKLNKLNFENVFVDIFVKSAIGTTLLVFFYSILITTYGTIFLGALPILIFLIYTNRKSINQNYSEQGEKEQQDKYHFAKIGGSLILFSIITFIINWFVVNEFCLPNWITNPHSDYIFYSKISKFLSISSQENVFHIANELLPHYFNGIVPYHYFDLWLNNLLLNFNSYSSYLNCQLIVVPFFLFLMYLGIAAIISFYIKSPWKILLISLFTIYFFGGIVIPIYELLPKTEGIEGVYFVLRSPQKLYPIYLFLILFIVSILSKTKNLALFSVCFLIFVYTQTLPAVVGGLVLLIIYNLFHKNYNEIFLILKFLLLTIAGFSIVFLLNQTPTVLEGNNPYSLSFVIKHFQLSDLRTMFNIAVVPQYWMVLVYIIPILITVLTAKELIKDECLKLICLFFIFIYGSSLFGWMLFFKELNSVQIFTNIAQPIANLMSVLILFSLMKKESKRNLAVTGFAIILIINLIISLTSYAQRDFDISILSKKFDPNYYSSIKEIVDKNSINNKTGVSLYGSEDFLNIYYFNSVHELSNPLSVYNDNYNTVGLGDFEMNVDNFSEFDKLRASFFTKVTYFRNYLDGKMKSENYPCKEFPQDAFEHQLQYIIDNKVEYAFIGPYYPNWNKLKLYSKFYFENKLNQEKFVVFKEISEIPSECSKFSQK